MALLYCDSFDHNTTPTNKGWTANQAIDAGAGRFGTNAQRITTTTNQHALAPGGGAFSTIIIGVALISGGGNAISSYFMNLFDGATEHIRLGITNTDRFWIGRAGTVLGTGTINVPRNVYNYLELIVLISDTVGTVQTWVNGVADLNLTNQDTRNGGNASVDTISLFNNGMQGSIPTGQTNIDDLVILDTSGSAPTNTRIGDVRVQYRKPNGNGNSSQFVGSDGNSTDNYLLVDEDTPNSDTDYVESSTVNDKDTYTYEDLTPTAGTVFGVQILPFCKKTDAGVRSIRSVARLSATETESADKTLSATYIYMPDMRETKPGGGAWSISDVNSAEFGVKVTA